MTTAFVLGNGLSRKDIDLAVLSKSGTIYGCNALYRDFVPDVLVATDRDISEHIQRSKYALTYCFYTRDPIGNLGARRIPEQWWKFSSGPVAVALAAEDKHTKIYMLGFDMGPSETGHFNNVYADTEFYKKSSAVPTYTGNWVNQIIEIIKKFPTTEFIRVVGTTTAQIKNLENFPNLLHTPIQQFR